MVYKRTKQEIVFSECKKKFAIQSEDEYNTSSITHIHNSHLTMNYTILKTIIDSTIQNYNQNNPTQAVTESHVSVISLTQHGLDLMIRCPHTHKEIRIHAEVNFMNGPTNNFTMTGNGMTTTTRQIDDNDVTAVHEALQKNTSISDLFGE